MRRLREIGRESRLWEYNTTTNSHITWEFSCKFVKEICKKRLFPAIFSKKFNWQVIPSWVIISYKIIKFASISYKICCEKCFIQNILQKNWQQFLANLLFITKFISIFYKKKFKTKLAGNMSFFSSESWTFYFEAPMQMQDDGECLRHLNTHAQCRSDHWNASK